MLRLPDDGSAHNARLDAPARDRQRGGRTAEMIQNGLTAGPFEGLGRTAGGDVGKGVEDLQIGGQRQRPGGLLKFRTIGNAGTQPCKRGVFRKRRALHLPAQADQPFPIHPSPSKRLPGRILRPAELQQPRLSRRTGPRKRRTDLHPLDRPSDGVDGYGGGIPLLGAQFGGMQREPGHALRKPGILLHHTVRLKQPLHPRRGIPVKVCLSDPYPAQPGKVANQESGIHADRIDDAGRQVNAVHRTAADGLDKILGFKGLHRQQGIPAGQSQADLLYIGQAGIRYAQQRGARRMPQRPAAVRQIGAQFAIGYRADPLAPLIQQRRHGRCVLHRIPAQHQLFAG